MQKHKVGTNSVAKGTNSFAKTTNSIVTSNMFPYCSIIPLYQMFSTSFRLLQHVFDPTLDKLAPRDYIVYACPGGELGSQLDEFYHASLIQCGWNGSHKSFPHVTLCQFFKVSNHHYFGLRYVVFTCTLVCVHLSPCLC